MLGMGRGESSQKLTERISENLMAIRPCVLNWSESRIPNATIWWVLGFAEVFSRSRMSNDLGIICSVEWYCQYSPNYILEVLNNAFRAPIR